jgi:hypothetical protein
MSTAQGVSRGKNEPGVMGNERLPRRLAHRRVGCVQKFAEFERYCGINGQGMPLGR